MTSLQTLPSQEHVRLIHDPDAVKDFGRLLNRDLRDDLVRVVMLLARRKYMTQEQRAQSTKGGRSENVHLTRQLVLADNNVDIGEKFLRQLMRYEVPHGAFVFSDDSEPIPSGCMALYISLQPKSCIDGFLLFQQEMMGELAGHARSQVEKASGLESFAKMESTLKGKIHVSTSQDHGNRLVDLDVDTKDEAKLKILRDFLRENNLVDHIVFSMETRGGFHVTLNRAAMVGPQFKQLHGFVRSQANTGFEGRATRTKGAEGWVSVKKDDLVPIPGTIQGGFPVRFCDFMKSPAP